MKEDSATTLVLTKHLTKPGATFNNLVKIKS